MEPKESYAKNTNSMTETEESRSSVESEHTESGKSSVGDQEAEAKNIAENNEEKVIAPPEEITADVAEAEEKQKAQAEENARRAQLVYPAKPEHEDPRKRKKSRFAGFSKKLTKFLSVLLVILFLAVIGLVVYRNLNANDVGADQFVLIGTQPNMVLGSESYVFNDYREYVKKTMGAGGLTEEDFSGVKYGLVSIPFGKCGEMEEMIEVEGAELRGNVMRVKVKQKAVCEEEGTLYANYLFPISKGVNEPTIEIEIMGDDSAPVVDKSESSSDN